MRWKMEMYLKKKVIKILLNYIQNCYNLNNFKFEKVFCPKEFNCI